MDYHGSQGIALKPKILTRCGVVYYTLQELDVLIYFPNKTLS